MQEGKENILKYFPSSRVTPTGASIMCWEYTETSRVARRIDGCNTHARARTRKEMTLSMTSPRCTAEMEACGGARLAAMVDKFRRSKNRYMFFRGGTVSINNYVNIVVNGLRK